MNIADRFDQRLGEIMGMLMVWPIIFAVNWLVLLGICHVTKSVFKVIKRTFDSM